MFSVCPPGEVCPSLWSQVLSRGGGHPSQVLGWWYPPSPQQHRPYKDTPRMVHLLRSHRRTFLFVNSFVFNFTCSPLLQKICHKPRRSPMHFTLFSEYRGWLWRNSVRDIIIVPTALFCLTWWISIRKRLVSKDEILFLMFLLYIHSKTEFTATIGGFCYLDEKRSVYFDMNDFMEKEKLWIIDPLQALPTFEMEKKDEILRYIFKRKLLKN